MYGRTVAHTSAVICFYGIYDPWCPDFICPKPSCTFTLSITARAVAMASSDFNVAGVKGMPSIRVRVPTKQNILNKKMYPGVRDVEAGRQAGRYGPWTEIRLQRSGYRDPATA